MAAALITDTLGALDDPALLDSLAPQSEEPVTAAMIPASKPVIEPAIEPDVEPAIGPDPDISRRGASRS